MLLMKKFISKHKVKLFLHRFTNTGLVYWVECFHHCKISRKHYNTVYVVMVKTED